MNSKPIHTHHTHTFPSFVARMLPALLLSASSLLAATGCGSASVSPKVVMTKAASDFSCKPEQVAVEKVTDNNWKAAGCGKETTYVCSGSSMMSDGMCMREGEIKSK